ncbi:MAG: helix-turn-helix transcriptional regulator [Clostridium tyrobutyricum]|jgi:transcriptional regulator with XRE-family HTH domain|uniref:helix-turn-helix domain-containing protein n=1 Tax=Clostridium tyrobutyricum TaxID=1519 RepID=UPI00242A6F53|nr:helix-turn-helix transcriptional regulator [Clostridium tyrobutyricum]MCH4237516.1 helix-turn-helix transcriptional regulator [Clostridium tyrobutyricum]MCH4259315.1 helix-turn-helix transcriptional regulator [Clostridium tyrobutyricum]
MNFKALRERQNLSLHDAAQKLGIGIQSLYRYENKKRIPSKKILKKIVSVYNCSQQELGEAIFNNLEEESREDVS